MSKGTGGPAFPTQINNSSNAVMRGFNGEEIRAQTFSAYPGMTLRDYFAAKALQGMSANPYFDDYEFDTVAEMAYAQADEMLAARVKL